MKETEIDIAQPAYICLHDQETLHQKWTIAPWITASLETPAMADKALVLFDGKDIKPGQCWISVRVRVRQTFRSGIE